tara:strand:- start:705 stop:1172 length:468 start_codon:yes stop_codon:yes gene_type:complete
MTIKDRKYLSNTDILELDSAFFDSYHENICKVAVENFKLDGELVTIIIGHSLGEAVLTKVIDKNLTKQALTIMKEIEDLEITSYSFISEGKMKIENKVNKVPVIIISSHNKSRDSRTTIYHIISRKNKKVALFATGEQDDNIWNYLFKDEERVLQ